MLIKKIKHQIGKIRDKVWPDRSDGWLRIYLTLECNLSCPYCVHLHNPGESGAGNYQLSPWQKWAEFINKTGRHVVFTGGEPFLYPGLSDLINAILPGIKVKIYTNFGVDPEAFIKLVKRPVIFFGTYHPGSGPVEKFIAHINKIRAAGMFRGSIHMVGWSQQLAFVQKAKQLLARDNWYAYIDQDQYTLTDNSSLKFKKKAECRRRILLVAPDGRRFICVSKMLRQKEDLGNVFTAGLGPDEATVLCAEYGYCNPCDHLGDTHIKVIGE